MSDEIPACHPPSRRSKTPVTAGQLSRGELLCRFEIIRIVMPDGSIACGVGMNGHRPMPVEDFVEAMGSIKTMADAMTHFALTGMGEDGKVAGMALYVDKGWVHFDRPLRGDEP